MNYDCQINHKLCLRIHITSYQLLLITCNADATHTGSLYLMHGVEQLGELIKTLPVLAGVLLTLYDGFPQLLDVRHPNLIEHRLALQAVLWHCRRE